MLTVTHSAQGSDLQVEKSLSLKAEDSEVTYVRIVFQIPLDWQPLHLSVWSFAWQQRRERKIVIEKVR